MYGMGSLYTSICPTLIAQGVGEAVSSLPPEAPIRVRVQIRVMVRVKVRIRHPDTAHKYITRNFGHEVPRILMLNGDHDRETAGIAPLTLTLALTRTPIGIALRPDGGCLSALSWSLYQNSPASWFEKVILPSHTP